MRKLLVALLLAGAVNVMAAGPVTITVIVSDNDSAETNRVTKIKAANRNDLKAWLDEKAITGNLLKQTAKEVSTVARQYVVDSLYGNIKRAADEAARNAVSVQTVEDGAP